MVLDLEKNDSVRLFENDRLIASTTWADHTNPTWGLYPDVTGNEYRNTKEATPGAPNKFEGIPEIIAWPGNGEVVIFDHEPTFLEDSSGLDFFNGQLYAVDNGTGKFWILDVSKDGKLSFAKGFENGKRVRFQKDADNAKAAGPDAEGITVDGDGFVYIASERDNNVKGVNFNTILKVDPNKEGDDLVALQQWDLTASLPQVSANMGIEAVEWVSNANVDGKLYDQNTNTVFDATNYPNAISSGVFFVALEDNGHVYAYVLNEDGSSVQIADIDGKIGGAMALDYDTYENVLWVVADNGYNNRAAKISFNGEKTPEIIHIMPASGVDISFNNEGFAIAEASFTKDGQRPVYRFKDGEKFGSLSIGSITSDYKENVDDDSENTGNEGTDGTGGVIKPDLTLSENAAQAIVSKGELDEAFTKVQKVKGVQIVEIYLEEVSEAKAYELTLPVQFLNKSGKNKRITVSSEYGTITLQGHMLSNAKLSKVENVTLVIVPLNSKDNRPMIELSVWTDGKKVDYNHPGASAEIVIPYEPTVEELKHSERLTVQYINDKGKTSQVKSAPYDSDKDGVIFTTTHFGKFAVNYVE